MAQKRKQLYTFFHVQTNVLRVFRCAGTFSMQSCWHFGLMFRTLDLRWLIIFCLSFKGSHSSPVIYPHLPLMGFKRRKPKLWNNPHWLSVLLKLHIWLFGKLKINDLLAKDEQRGCAYVRQRRKEWEAEEWECLWTCTLCTPVREPLKPWLWFASPLSVSHVLYLQSFIQMEMRFTSFFSRCRWQGQ